MVIRFLFFCDLSKEGNITLEIELIRLTGRKPTFCLWFCPYVTLRKSLHFILLLLHCNNVTTCSHLPKWGIRCDNLQPSCFTNDKWAWNKLKTNHSGDPDQGVVIMQVVIRSGEEKIVSSYSNGQSCKIIQFIEWRKENSHLSYYPIDKYVSNCLAGFFFFFTNLVCIK